MPRQNSKPVGVLSALAGLLGFSALAGVLVTALVTPALAVTSMTASSSIGIFESLPDYMEIGDQSQRNTILAKYEGEYQPIAHIYKQNREEVGWDEVSPYIKDAVVAGEDRRFYKHGGVDVQSIVRAAVGNIAADEIGSGASTLTMQLVKNILIQEAIQIEDEKERNAAIRDAQAPELDRKLKEAKYAIGLEKRHDKKEIMLAYLNIAGFGGNTYGVESASQQYFSKSAKDLNLVESASLIAIVQQPNKRNLDDPEKYPANKSRRDTILDIMLELKMVTAAEHEEARNTPVEDYVKPSSPRNGCMYAIDAQTFCDYIVKNVKNFAALGGTEAERQANWDRGGYSVYTTLDLVQHRWAQKQVNAQAPASESRFQLGAAATSIEVGTGRILLMAQNKAFDDSFDGGGPTTTAVNFNTDREYGGSSGFPSGSTYKVFTLVEWLKAGHGVNEIVDGSPRPFKSFPAHCHDGGTWVGTYNSRNFGGAGGGRMTVLQATAASTNNAFLSMAQKLDLCDIRDTAMSMGVHMATGEDPGYNPATLLGTNEVAPMTMAGAIATIAGNGLYCAPIAVDYFVGPDGEELEGQKKDCRQAMPPEAAAGAAYALQAVMTRGTGTGSNPWNGIPVMGKTGTTDGTWQTWMMGASSKAGLAVWVGNIVGKQSLGAIAFGEGNGSTARHRIFKPIMTALTNAFGGSAFPDPSSKMLSGNPITVPATQGQSFDRVQELLESLGFAVADGGDRPSDLPAGTVVGTDPPAGSRVSTGSQVRVYKSDGSLIATMPDVTGMDVGDARKAIRDAGMDPGKVSFTWVASEDEDQWCSVTSSDPAAGTATSEDAAITLTVASKDDGEAPPGCKT